MRRDSIHVAFLFITSPPTCSVVSRGGCGVLGCGVECFDFPKWRQHLVKSTSCHIPVLWMLIITDTRTSEFAFNFLCYLDDLPAVWYYQYHIINLPQWMNWIGKVRGIVKRNRKSKVNLPLSTLWKHIGGAEVYLHSLLISALNGGQLHAPVALNPMEIDRVTIR
jgi:hypothetical protein